MSLTPENEAAKALNDTDELQRDCLKECIDQKKLYCAIIQANIREKLVCFNRKIDCGYWLTDVGIMLEHGNHPYYIN